ncbi:MAG: GDSL-type esterase/lipase family protein [Bifidobacteriaceae bacterium]|jgi:lysophospholipase L1-like esterase|nr:GDSL-type esterase/lipase family protein [Bifidobacteriaceae bacterium]
MSVKRTLGVACAAVLGLGAFLVVPNMQERAGAADPSPTVSPDLPAPTIDRYWPLAGRSVEPGDVEFKGSVRLQRGDEQDVNVVFLVDVSSSTMSPRGMDCNGDGARDSLDDYNLDGRAGDVLDCEISAITSLNAEFRGFENMGSRINVAVIAFGTGAAAASMTRVGDYFVSPAHHEQDPEDPSKPEVVPAFDTVASSLRVGVVGQYERHPVGTGTNFNAAVSLALGLLNGREGDNYLLMLSDGQATASSQTLQALADAASSPKARTFAVGSGASCDGSLGAIAAATGESCVRVADPVKLTSGIGSTKPSYIDRVEVRLSDRTYRTYQAQVDAIGNWSVTVPTVTVGRHTAMIAVHYTDGRDPSYVVWGFDVKLQVFEHVALGDSYAAGEGNPEYINQKICPYSKGGRFGGIQYDVCMESKEDIAFMCHRSKGNWARKVYEEAYGRYKEHYTGNPVGEFNFQACSGATIPNFDSRKQEKEWVREPRVGPVVSNELQLRWLTPDVDLVTVSLGGNDAGFAPILVSCSFPNCLNKEFGGTGVALTDWMRIRLALMNNELDGVYSAIRARVSADTQVVVTTYPRLFDQSGAIEECDTENEVFSDSEADWVNGLSDTMAGIILAQAPKSDLLVADTRGYFVGRGVCTMHAAINGVQLGRVTTDFGDLTYGIDAITAHSGSFHPNEKGMALYAQAVDDALREASDKSASRGAANSMRVMNEGADGADNDLGEVWFAGVVDDPDGVLAEYTADAVEAVRSTTFVDLYADHKTDADFEGTQCGAVVPDEAVPLSANGFRGDSQVRVTVTAIGGDGSSREILGDDVLSDADGILRHETVLPEEIGGDYVLVEVVGLNDQGGVAYGNTFLEATSDAGCVTQAKQAGAIPGAGGPAPTDGPSASPTPGAPGTSDGSSALRTGGSSGEPSPVDALERTGAHSASVAGLSLLLMVTGLVLCARRTRGRLDRRTGQHARIIGS